jgi:putative spermidine/putrescine transport system ATP-binding protein
MAHEPHLLLNSHESGVGGTPQAPQLSQRADFVVFDHVQKSYDGLSLVVKDLNLGIGRGEFLTMLGPSGSGKTTCLMMLAGFETATHGEIRLAGRDINRVPPHKRDIGMVFQNYALFPHMTVAENLAFPLEVRRLGQSAREAKIRRALDMVRMGNFADRRPAQLSGGQQQRIALARALVFDPALVLMDEPLGALDKQLREHMQFEIKQLHASLGLTVIYVTHDQGEALTMSNRIAVFNDGRIQQLAAPADLYERPTNSFVAQFIGANNRLPGTVVELSQTRALVRLQTGELIDTTPVNVTAAGQKTLVSIRPERVEFKPELMPPGIHTIEAEVLQVIYMGDILQGCLKVAGSDDFIIKMRNTLGQPRLTPGNRIRIGWHPQDARALDPI